MTVDRRRLDVELEMELNPLRVCEHHFECYYDDPAHLLVLAVWPTLTEGLQFEVRCHCGLRFEEQPTVAAVLAAWEAHVLDDEGRHP